MTSLVDMFWQKRYFHTRGWVKPVIAALALLSLCACSTFTTGKASPSGKTMVIPDFPTSKDQYDFAVAYKDAEIISTDPQKRRSQLDKVSQCYERVIRNFPSDQTYAPLAYMGMADCVAMTGDYQNAGSMYETVMKNYPTNAYMQARALFSLGKTYDRQNQFQKAKDTYKQVMDRFGGDNQSGAIREVVKQASQLYYQVHEAPVKGGRKTQQQ